MRTKIDYGIDLGTTNSAIARMENGVPRIIKSDILKDIVPSCVYFNKKQVVQVGDPAMNVMKNDTTRAMKDLNVMRAMKDFKKGETNSYIEFKRTMGTTHTYRSSHMNREIPSEELSAEVLKKLKSLVLDENLSSIVITVPAKFLSPQNEATIKAAKLAGFKQVVLLQEPVAAATAYGLDAEKKDGYWLVFDFGDGTFDATLVKAEEGILSVKDTDGDNWLGGKNLDEAIVDQIILPYLQKNFVIEGILNDPDRREILRNGVKRLAEEAKIQMSFRDKHNILTDLGDLPFEDEEGEAPEVDVTVTQKDMERVLSPIFQKAIDIAKGLLKRNNLQGADLDALIPVGGPTHSPILRCMLREQITEHVDTSKDPMTVVAQGAAIYASTVDVDIPAVAEDPKTVQQGGGDGGSTPYADKLRLDVKYEATGMEKNALVSIKALKEKSTERFPNEIFVGIRRVDEAWSSGLKRISDRKATLIEVLLLENRSNSFEIQVFDEKGNRLDCEPDQFNIIQSIDFPKTQVLSYHVGIAKYFENKDGLGFFPVKGLEKNRNLPATGVVKGLKTTCKIRKGEKDDWFCIGIYQGDCNAVGADPELNDLIREVIITGEDIPYTLPQNSDVEITIKVDKAQTMHFKAFFPLLDYTKELDIEIKQAEVPSEEDILKKISAARQDIHEINATGEIPEADRQTAAKVSERLSELEKSLKAGESDLFKRLEIHNNLRRQLFELYPVKAQMRYRKAEKEMTEAFYELDTMIYIIKSKGINRMPGYDEKYLAAAEATCNDFPGNKETISREKNIRKTKEVTYKIVEQKFVLEMTPTGGEQYVIMFNENFDSYRWKDREQAKLLIERGKSLIAEAIPLGRIPSTMEIVHALFGLVLEMYRTVH
ncbi:MAG: Hsp70 family protein [Tannerella sp.]|jgi:molecular chaperone DnaK|nr:Hsp70 family protein [Tannerella sp.]